MDWSDLDELILVAAHAVYIAGDFSAPTADASWYLEPYQKGEPPCYVEHMRRGVEIAAERPRSLLVFSGAQTRRDPGPKSEAQSYWAIADHFRWWGSDVKPRATTEEFARDSFENLLFGICRFRECAGRYPERVAVVSWEFKRQRFDLHREAISFPAARFEFAGANNPADLDAALRGEASAVALFRADPFGGGPALSAKRVGRNPFRRSHGYAASCPELRCLLEGLAAARLPWS